MAQQRRFTVSDLWKRKSEPAPGLPAASAANPRGTAGPDGRWRGLGLEIANIAALPDAEDYAQDEFYRANFAPSEIARCRQEPRAKAAFQKILAAKRAIVKSGAAAEPAEGLGSIEIGFDSEGRPSYPGCLLSLSGTDTVAAAACLWSGQDPAPGKPAAGRREPVAIPTGVRIVAVLVLLSLLVLFGLVLFKVLQLAFLHR
jgi:phosphopantetheinyl transferase (holo-ACP synthase)